MNAERLRGAMLSLLAAGALIWPSLAQSMEFPYLFKDPLRTMPEVIEKGAVLPGDSSPIPRSIQRDPLQPLTLVEAVDCALSNNQKAKGAWADIKVQAGALGQAYAAYLPVISGTTNWTKDKIEYSDSSYPSSTVDKYNVMASATWRILDFGGRAAGRHAAENQLAAALATYDSTLQETLAAVTQAYFDAISAAASLKAKTEDEEVARRTLTSAKEREAKGAISQSDTLRAATALAKASLGKSRAQGDCLKTLAVLRHYLGLPGNAVVILPPELNENQGGVAERRELTLLLEEAQRNHPSIIAARKQLEAAKEQVVVAKSSGLPTLNLSGNYYRNTRPGEAVSRLDSTETTLVVALNIPLFDGFASTYKLRGAQARVEKEESNVADLEQQVAMKIVRAHADTDAALGTLEASATLLESAQKALAVSQRKYTKGAADITEVLSTQSALADAWNERVRCLAEWHSARLQLLATAGKMGRFAVTDSSAH